MSVEVAVPVGSVLACEHAWKIYRSPAGVVKAVQNVTLDVRSGEILCIRGPSGSGKSTLLAMLGGLEGLTKGEVVALGYRYAAMSQHELSAFRRKYVGFVFQELSLIPHLTARENVVAPLLFDGLSWQALGERSDALLEWVGLLHRARHYPREMSYGERQRVAFARAIVNDPAIVIADEPTANLDTANVERVVAILEELRSRKTTVVLATHDERLEAAADRIVTMMDGVLTGAHR